jgi:hypothetical protein
MSQIFEWRRYVAAPGRADDLVRRFEDGTFDLFADHGIEVLMFGRDTESPDEIHYVVPWPDTAAMLAGWSAFAADERWLALRARSEADGPLVESIERRVLSGL